MFGTIRKHQTWLWAVIITLTIVSFVVFFSPFQKMSSGGGQANLGSINGERVSREDFGQAQAEVLLNYYIQRGSWPDENKIPGFDINREAYYRLLLTQKQKEYGIHVSDDAVMQVARGIIGQFQKPSVSGLDAFKEVLNQARLSLSQFEVFVRHQIGIQQLSLVTGLSGRLVTPAEAKALYIREHEELATEAVFFPASNYLASVTVTPEALGNYFTNQLPNYRIPERLQVNYVHFDLTNYLTEATNMLAKMTNLDLNIEQAYRENPTNLLAQFKAVSLEDAKVKIRERRLKDIQTQLARKEASEFAYNLDEKQALGAEALPTLAQDKKLTVAVTTPFDRFQGPTNLNVGPGFASVAFSLTNTMFAGPLVGDDAVYVISLNKRIPSEIPSFEQVREKVDHDYKLSLATALARNAGNEFAQSATNQIAQGKSFADICAAAKVKLVELPPFSISTQTLGDYDSALLNQFKLAAFGSAPGKIAGYYPTDDDGFVLYVKAKIPVSEEKLQRELPNFVNLVRGSRQNDAFQEWFQREAKRAFVDVPMFREQQQKQAPRAARS